MGPLAGIEIVDMTSVLGGERVLLELTFVVLIAITVVDLSFVIPGRRAAANPESITPVREYGFRVRAKGRAPE
jgi:hypothetical protein